MDDTLRPKLFANGDRVRIITTNLPGDPEDYTNSFYRGYEGIGEVVKIKYHTEYQNHYEVRYDEPIEINGQTIAVATLPHSWLNLEELVIEELELP